jgi:Xaa-Pro dipeptidase
MGPSYFAREEYDARLVAVREAMMAKGVELFLVSAPENIFYLTGLDHWGYFAPHILVVPAEGELVIVTREMETVTIANQVCNARFEGHPDHVNVADVVSRLLVAGGHVRSKIGIEAWSAALPHGLAMALRHQAGGATWLDLSGLIDDIRMVKSPAEQAYMRCSARISDAGAAAAIEAIREGASELEVAGQCQRAMTEAGGTFPGFGPFIRSNDRLGEEHTTWRNRQLAKGSCVLLELSGCIARYHAPLGRLIHVGQAPNEASDIALICWEALDAALGTLRDGVRFRDVYAAWQSVVDRAGLRAYRRHHCGYVVGIGFPPSWTGGNKVTGLRYDSDLIVRTGTTFHVLSWLMGTGRGDFFMSDTVLVGPHGVEVLTRTPAGITTR